MAKHRVNQLPVLDNDKIVGIVTDRDLRDAYPTSMMIDQTKEIDEFAEKVTVEEVMTHDIFIGAAGKCRWRRRWRFCAITASAHCQWSKSKELVGIITRSDILDFVLERRSRKRAEALEKARDRQRSGEKAVAEVVARIQNLSI